MRRAASAGAALLALTAAGLAGPAYAGVAPDHFSASFDEEPVAMPVDGLGPGCPDFTGTLTEYRHLDISGWLKEDGTGHASTAVTATVSLVPDDSAEPSYTGAYDSRQTGQFTWYGDNDRVVTTTTHGSIEGTDGSSYRINEVVHFSVDDSGTARVWFDRFHCAG